MMKKYKIQFVICLCCSFFPFFGIGQAAEAPMTENQKLELTFEKKYVSLTQLDAFELRSIQKVNDLANYLDYIADSSMETAFREQAQQLALELFSHKETLFYYYKNGDKIKSTIGQYLDALAKTKETKTNFEFADITKIEEAQKGTESPYFWHIRFMQKEKSETEVTVRTIVTLKVSLQKIEKKFGSEIKKIWEVCLDEMVSLELAP